MHGKACSFSEFSKGTNFAFCEALRPPIFPHPQHQQPVPSSHQSMPKNFNARKRPAYEAHTQLTLSQISDLRTCTNTSPSINTLLHPSPPLPLRTIITSLQIASSPRNQDTQSSSSKQPMEIESVKCECCGLREDCTPDYIASVRAGFHGQWLCGLCCEAVRDEACRKKAHPGVEEAVRAHMAFCKMFKSNPAVRVADGMRQMLRRRSGDMSKPESTKKYSTSQVGDESSVTLY